ncbi:hypothetical protein C8J57DRAFT_130884 [Mycena rebaudengoi]|nr:hypothetical protein C8J57DRAFT_130884 [Mycena rebaudengoi]
MSSVCDPLCSLPSHPDIYASGVRTAVYVQTFLSFLPIASLLQLDQQVSLSDFVRMEEQATAPFITSFSILIAAILRAQTSGLTAFDANTILSLGWMNSTRIFIYFLLYIQHKSQVGRGQIGMAWAPWIKHLRGELAPPVAWSRSGWRKRLLRDPERSTFGSPTKSIFSRVVIVTGSLHLTLLAAFGIWFWSNPRSFGVPAAPGSTVILRLRVSLESRALRFFSLVMYSLFLAPGLNLILPMALFLALFRVCHALRRFHDKPSIAPLSIGAAVLLAINVMLVVDIELALQQISSSNEDLWTFGEVLAIMFLVLDLRDVLDTIFARRRFVAIREALGRQVPISQILHLATQARADINIRTADTTFKTLLHLAVARSDAALVDILLRLEADPNIAGGIIPGYEKQ